MPSFLRWRLQTSGFSCSVLPPPSRRSSDALRQRDSRSAAHPYKAEKQGIGRRAFRARSQSRIAMLYFLRLKIPNCLGQLRILFAKFLKLLIIVPVDLGLDRGRAGHCRFGTNRRSEERRVGKECVGPVRARWSPYN